MFISVFFLYLFACIYVQFANPSVYVQLRINAYESIFLGMLSWFLTLEGLLRETLAY